MRVCLCVRLCRGSCWAGVRLNTAAGFRNGACSLPSSRPLPGIPLRSPALSTSRSRRRRPCPGRSRARTAGRAPDTGILYSILVEVHRVRCIHAAFKGHTAVAYTKIRPKALYSMTRLSPIIGKPCPMPCPSFDTVRRFVVLKPFVSCPVVGQQTELYEHCQTTKADSLQARFSFSAPRNWSKTGECKARVFCSVLRIIFSRKGHHIFSTPTPSKQQRHRACTF